jgi:cell division septal protein FtsQ
VIIVEEKIKSLEKRIEKLEKVEKRRKIKNIIVLSFYGAIIVGLIALVWIAYVKIKPYKDQLDNIRNIGSGLKSDTIIGGDSGFGDLGDFFNNFFNY